MLFVVNLNALPEHQPEASLLLPVIPHVPLAASSGSASFTVRAASPIEAEERRGKPKQETRWKVTLSKRGPASCVWAK